MGKSRKMTDRDWPNPGLRHYRVIWCDQQVNWLNLNRGFDETAV